LNVEVESWTGKNPNKLTN